MSIDVVARNCTAAAFFVVLFFGVASAQDRKPLSQEALLELMRANDEQRQGRILTVERSGVDKTIPIPYWKYPDLADLIDQTKPVPDELPYVFTEQYLVSGNT